VLVVAAGDAIRGGRGGVVDAGALVGPPALVGAVAKLPPGEDEQGAEDEYGDGDGDGHGAAPA